MRFRNYFLPVAIILVGLALRLYQLEQRSGFDFDQETAAWWIKNLVVDHKISLIGQEISTGGVFIGPFFYYLLTPFYLLTKLYPLGGNIFVTFIALLTMIMIYHFTKLVFNKSCAAITTFLYAINPGIINFDRTVAPSNMIVLLSISTAYLLIKFPKSWLDRFLLGIILGLTFSVHPTAVLLIPIAVIYFFFSKERLNLKQFLLIILPIVLLILPLVFFNFRHGGLIVNNIVSTIFSGEGSPFNLINRFFSMSQLLLVYWAGTLISNDSFLVKLPLFVLAIWVFLKNSGLLLKIWVLVSLTALIFYPRHVPEYYFLLLTPVVLIYTVGFLQKSRIKKIILLIIILASVFLSIFRLKYYDNKLGLYYKNAAVEYIVDQANDQPFTVYYSNEPGLGFGFNYLFWWQKAKIADKMPKKFLIVVPISDRIYRPSQDFGNIKVVILPEETWQEKLKL